MMPFDDLTGEEEAMFCGDVPNPRILSAVTDLAQTLTLNHDLALTAMTTTCRRTGGPSSW
jgi:hypothetical protein